MPKPGDSIDPMCVGCLPSCINPEEGLHHWRCPHYVHADKVQESLRSADEDLLPQIRPPRKPAEERGERQAAAPAWSSVDSSVPLEYRDVRGLEAPDPALYKRYMADRQRETRGFGYTLAVQVMFVCIAAAVYGVPRLRTEWFWALVDNDAADAIDSTLSDELEVES